jgi:hypothetical protein
MAHVGEVGTEIAPAIPDDPALASRIDGLLHHLSDAHPPLRGWLATPVCFEDARSYGLLQLSDKAGGADFTEEDANNVRDLAGCRSTRFEPHARALQLRLDRPRTSPPCQARPLDPVLPSVRAAQLLDDH